MSLGAAGVEGRGQAKFLSFGLGGLREFLLAGKSLAKIDNVINHRLVIVSCERDLESRLDLSDKAKDSLHRLQRTLIHRDHGLFKPAFRLEMPGEVCDESPPIFIVLLTSGSGLEGRRRRCRLVDVVELQRPRNH